jgi:hypothetical protein
VDEYPWTALYLAALTEFDRAKHLHAIDVALSALAARMEALSQAGGAERAAIADAALALNDLRRRALTTRDGQDD